MVRQRVGRPPRSGLARNNLNDEPYQPDEERWPARVIAHVRKSAPQQLVKYLVKDPVPEKEKKIKKPERIRRTRRNIKESDIQRIILARYGLNPLQNDPIRTIKEVSQMLSVKRETCDTVLRRFIKNGYRIVLGRKLYSGRKRIHIPQNIQDFLLDRQTLQDWAVYTLEQRSAKILAEFQYHIDYQRLGVFYKRNGIRPIRPVMKYQLSARKFEEIQNQRIDRAKSLATIHSQNKPIIYIDETTFNVQMYMRKVWTPKEFNLRVKVPVPRSKNRTLYGAIGNCLNQPVYHVAESTNTIEFKVFLKKIIESLNDQYTKPYLVFDQHAAHYGGIAEYGSNFKLLPLPGYSCRLNSIEALWVHIKRNFRKILMHRDFRVNTEAVMEQCIWQACEMVNDRIINSCFKSNRKYLLKKVQQ